jgi:hypothetical protein
MTQHFMSSATDSTEGDRHAAVSSSVAAGIIDPKMSGVIFFMPRLYRFEAGTTLATEGLV